MSDPLDPLVVYIEDVNQGDVPNYSSNVTISYYELPTPGPMSVVRPPGQLDITPPSLAWSDDGTNLDWFY